MVEEPEDYVEPEIQDAEDLGNPEQVNAARKRAARLRQKRIDFVRDMMNSQNGRLWAYDLLTMGHIAEPTHTPGDSHATAFKEGERNFANKILFDINDAAPEMYMQMLTEGKTEK